MRGCVVQSHSSLCNGGEHGGRESFGFPQVPERFSVGNHGDLFDCRSAVRCNVSTCLSVRLHTHVRGVLSIYFGDVLRHCLWVRTLRTNAWKRCGRDAQCFRVEYTDNTRRSRRKVWQRRRWGSLPVFHRVSSSRGVLPSEVPSAVLLDSAFVVPRRLCICALPWRGPVS